MQLNNFLKLVGVFLGFSFINLIHAALLSENDIIVLKHSIKVEQAAALGKLLSHTESHVNDKPLKANKPLDHASYLETKSAQLKDTFSTTLGNPTFNEMFDNITDHYTTYSKYLENASTKEIMDLRIKVMEYYKTATEYASVQTKFDNFVIDFRPATAAFDKFAFSIIDFLIFPDLGVKFFTATQLARLRKDVISTVPLSATPSQRSDFVSVVDGIISKFLNGKDLGTYFTETA